MKAIDAAGEALLAQTAEDDPTDPEQRRADALVSSPSGRSRPASTVRKRPCRAREPSGIR